MATPGMRELLSVGKVYELAQFTRHTGGADPYDLVIVDSPAAGHGIGILRTPRTFAEIARVGPIAGTAQRIAATVADPDFTAVVAVCIAEEMPVNETLWLRDQLRADGLELSAVFANALLPERFTAAEARRAARTPTSAVGPARTARSRPRSPSTRGRPRSARSSLGCVTGSAPACPASSCRSCSARRWACPSCACSRTRWGASHERRRDREPCSTARGSASAAARAASARRRPPPRSRSAWPPAARGSRWSRSTPPAAWPTRSASTSLRTSPAASTRRGSGADAEGELWAMMLDPKRTFDELIERLAPSAERAEEIKRNRIYRELSSAVSGSQEFTAIAKLHELAQEGGFDLLVLDTPPSRNALDFLEAPGRLTSFLEGSAMRTLIRPTGIGMRVLGRGASPLLGALRRVTGLDLLSDLSTFFGLLGDMTEDFHTARGRRRTAAARSDDRVPARHRRLGPGDRGGDLVSAHARPDRSAVRRRGRQPRAP